MNLNLNQNKKRIQLAIIGVVVIVIAVLVIPIFFLKQKAPPPQLTVQKLVPPKEETQNIPNDIKTIKQKIVDSKESEDNGDLIIKKTGEYRITYVPPRETFLVYITKEPTNNSKSSAEEFFKNFGLKQADLCTLPVRFIIDFSLKAKNPTFNPLPNGCS